MNMLVKLSGALSASEDVHTDLAGIVKHRVRAPRPHYISQRRQRRRDRMARS